MKKHKTFDGHKHSEEAKAAIGTANSVKQAGTKNSQYGTKWMRLGDQDKKVSAEEIHDHLSDGWEFGRIYKLKNPRKAK